MKRQFAIFLFAFSLMGLLGLMYGPQGSVNLAQLLPTATQGLETTISLQAAGGCGCTQSDWQNARNVLSRRLGQLGLPGPYEIIIAEEAEQLEVRVAARVEMPYLVNVITQVGEVEFIDGGPEPPLGQVVNTTRRPDVVADRAGYQTLFGDQEIRQVVPPDADAGDIFYEITLAPEATGRLEAFQGRSGHHVCLVLDNIVTSCSDMYHWRGTTLEVLPRLSSGLGLNMSDLRVLLESGPLPFPLELVN